MFDERHLQLTSAYAKASQNFTRAFIYPLGELLYKSIERAIDLKCKIELGQDTYILTPDDNGGWKWSKYDNKNITDEEIEEVEELLADLLPKLLPGRNTPDNSLPLLRGSDTLANLPNSSPPDLPPISPSPNIPPSFSPPAITVEVMATAIDYLNTEDRALLNDYSIQTQQDIDLNSIINDNSFDIKEVEIISPKTSIEFDATNSVFFSRLSPEYYIQPHHWQELVIDSAIAPEIAQLNFQSLQINSIEQEHEAWEYLMYSEQLERTNTGRLSNAMLQKYSHIEAGGWWCHSGVDPRCFPSLSPGEKPDEKLWGCYKPDHPRQNRDHPGKTIKYEHPPKTELSIFLLNVPDSIAERIYQKAEVNPSQSDKARGFWYCVWKHNLAITITEGAKKAACLLSYGEAAIGLPGIYAGYRTKNHLGEPIDATLHPELAVFATNQRLFKICFDYETRLKTQRNINIANYRTGQLLEAVGATVNVISLPGPQKGVDDFVVAQGAEAYEKLSAQALPLQTWHKNNPLPNLRLTLTLKDGTVKTFEQKGETMATIPENESEPNIGINKKLRPKFPLEIVSVSGDIEVIDLQINESTIESNDSPENIQSIDFWGKKKDVTLYQQNFFRQRLESSENKQIAAAAYQLLKKYGLDQNKTGEERLYLTDAFIIKGHGGDKYSIYRRHDHIELMTFQADQWGKVGNIHLSTEVHEIPDSQEPSKTKTQKQIQILPIERQEFLLVAEYLKAGKELPSVDTDPRKIASILASLSPDGTHNILESFKQSEVLQILTQTLTTFKSDELTLGNYRIVYQQSHTDSTSILQLFKNEHNGREREAVRFDINRTATGISHQATKMAILEDDLKKLRLLAQNLKIDNQSLAKLVNKPTATRDINLPIHPQIARELNNLENPVRVHTQTPSKQQASSSYSPPLNQNQDNIALPLHPLLSQYWEQFEKEGSWAEVALHGHNELQSQIQQTGKLTIPEQRELYQKIQNQAWSEIQQHGQTDIVLPPLAEVIRDLRLTINQQPQTNSPNPVRNTQLPLHPDLATHWENLEANRSWSSVANQYNNPLRQKLENTGKLTIGEQRELYQKILLQSQIEQQNQGKTNISLPPLSQVIQDLLDSRSQIINDTYAAKVEIDSIKSHTPQQKTNSQELEL